MDESKQKSHLSSCNLLFQRREKGNLVLTSIFFASPGIKKLKMMFELAKSLKPTQHMAKLQLHAQCPISHQLKLSKRTERNAFTAEIVAHQKVARFTQPLSSVKTPKIYIIQSIQTEEVLYVGYTSERMATRLNYGLDPRHQHNYKGYQWADQKEVKLTCWVFQPFSGNDSENDGLKRIIQNLEAELVYFIREKTGKWPSAQREIHFGNEHSSEVRSWADRIIAEIGVK